MQPSLKIAYVLKRFPRLSETFILNEILELERRGASVQVYSFIDPAVAEPEAPRHELVRQLAAEVIYLPRKLSSKSWVLKRGGFSGAGFAEEPWNQVCRDGVALTSHSCLQAAAVAGLVWTHGVQHLHAHFASEAGSVAMLASRFTGIPFSMTAHAKDIFHESVDRELLRQKMQEARFVVTVSDYNRQYLAEVIGDPAATRIVRLYNGIDLDRFRPGPPARREPDLIVAVGRLQEKKGFYYLVEACRLLRDRGPSFRCLIVGEGTERPALEQQINAAGLAEHVVLAGAQPQEQLIETLKRAAVFVLPCVITATGDRDALPTVLLEAMAVGLPTISTQLVGIPEIVQHGQTGLLVPPGDSPRLAEAIGEILKNPDLQHRFGQAGREKAERLFDLRKNVPVLHDLFVQAALGQETVASTEAN